MSRSHFIILILLRLIHAVTPAGCFLGIYCGRVENKSQRTLRFTTILDFNCRKSQHDRCDVFNLGSSQGCEVPPPGNVRRVSCKQCELISGRRAGGQGVDVDAFTYAEIPFRVKGFKKANGDVERNWVNFPKGVWVQIHSYEKAVCTYNRAVDKPECVVNTRLLANGENDDEHALPQQVLVKQDRTVKALASPTCAASRPI